MPVQSSVPKLFAALRVVESEICFLDEGGAFDALGPSTLLFVSRDECYKAAREVRALVVAIGYVAADSAGLEHPIWEAQRVAAGGLPGVLRRVGE